MADDIEIEYEIDEVEGWRDVDDDRRRYRPRPGRERPPRWRLAPLLVVGALAVVVASVVATSRSGPKQATVATTTPSTAAPSTTIDESAVDATTFPRTVAPSARADAIVSTTGFGAPFLPSVTGTKLVALRDTTLVEVDVDAGLIRQTQLPRIGSTGAMMVVAGSDWTIVRPFDNVRGYLIRAGEPASTALAGALAPGTFAIYPGPDDGHVWVMTQGNDGPFGRLQLVDLDGNVVGSTPPLDGLQPLGVDSTGRLIVQGLGGTYVVDGDALRRVTSGALLAIGPSTSLAGECDDAHHCTMVVIDNVSGERRPLPSAAPPASFGIGTVSPDGRFAIYVADDGSRGVRLLDLGGGAETSLPEADQSGVGFGASPSAFFVWSADSRYLFFVSLGGTLSAYDVTTGKSAPLATNISGLSQLTARPRT